MLTGKTNEEKIWNYLLSKVGNEYGVAGIIGNLYAESGLRPENLQNSYEKKLGMNDLEYTSNVDTGKYKNFETDRAGYGLAQWTSQGRKTGLLAFVKSRKVSISDLETQLDYLWKELTEKYTSVLNTCKTATDIRTASNAVLIKFEAPASKDTQATQDRRAGYAQDFYNKYAKGNNKPTPTPAKPKYTNSSLVSYTKISPFRNSPRNHSIDTISIHCMAGNLSVETCGNLFCKDNKNASSNYGIGTDGRIALYVEEQDRSWCTSNAANDNRAITIEVANDGGAPDWHVSDKAMESLIKLVADICKRNNIKELKWQGNKNLIGQVDKQNMTVHRWFAAKACPGDYLYNKHGYIANEVNKILNGQVTPPAKPVEPTPAPSASYLVKVTADALNIRKGPGTEYPTNGCIRDHGVYTIVDTQKNWGKLKSGLGWICLDYTQKK